MPRPNRDHEHLALLRDYYAEHHIVPSFAGLGELFGFKGKAAAYKLAQRLIGAGYLEQAAGGRLCPTNRFFERAKLDDKLPAGMSEASDWSEGIESHELDRLLVDQPSRTRLMDISGNSMVEAGILDGDLAIVELQNEPRPGEFVVAVIDGDYTVKELRFDGEKPVFVPHNKDYEDIHPQTDVKILGVLRGIARKYERPYRNQRGERK